MLQSASSHTTNTANNVVDMVAGAQVILSQHVPLASDVLHINVKNFMLYCKRYLMVEIHECHLFGVLLFYLSTLCTLF